MYQQDFPSQPLPSRIQTFPRLGRIPLAPAPKPISTSLICGLLSLLDVVLLLASAVFAYTFWLIGDPYSTWSQYALVVAFGTLLTVNIFWLARLYDDETLNRPWQTMGRVVLCWCTVAAVLVAVSFLSKTSDDYSRLWALLWFALGLVGLVATRWLLFARVARWSAEGRLQRRVAIVGAGPLAHRLANHFVADPKSGVHVVGVFSGGPEPQQPWKRRLEHGGDLDHLIRLARMEAVDTIIVADTDAPMSRLHTIFNRLREVAADVRFCPSPMALELVRHKVSHYAGVPLFNVVDRPLSGWRFAVKEIEDRILASFILLLISPLMLAVAALIKLDSPGPVFFRQKRYGYNNHFVEVLKFRTMRHDLQDQRAEQLTQRNDPRVTRIGAVLRRWSLDELPQFINVLRGEMSIVGPRPHAVAAKAGGLLYQDAVPHYAARHRVKPGITGWAQINGWRGTTSTVRQIEKRVEHDMYYIENWSLWLDLKIIFLTVFKGFSAQNAY